MKLRHIRPTNEIELYWLENGDVFIYNDITYLKLVNTTNNYVRQANNNDIYNVFNLSNKKIDSLSSMTIVRKVEAELVIIDKITPMDKITNE